MTKELEQNIKRMEADLKAYTENATAEIEAMKQKLKNGDKFEFQGGSYKLLLTSHHPLRIQFGERIKAGQEPYRTRTKEAGERLLKHVKNQIILWQVAEFVNDGWTRESGDTDNSYTVYFDERMARFDGDLSCGGVGIFKNREAAEKAVEILDKQADELGWSE